MSHKKEYLLLLLMLCISYAAHSKEKTSSVFSPDGRNEIKIQFSSKNGSLSYDLARDQQLLIKSSPLGFKQPDESMLPNKDWNFISETRNEHNSIWTPLWGKRSVVKDQYNEVVLSFSQKNRNFQLQVRAYDDGIAFRYLLPLKESTGTLEELTAFCFNDDYTAWYYNKENANIGPEKLSYTDGVRLPVATLKVSDTCYLAIHEADLRTGDPLLLSSTKSSFDLQVISKLQAQQEDVTSAWRVVFTGDTPGKLVDSHLLELLNPEPEGDFSWVKSGIALWDWRIDGAEIDGFRYTMTYPSWIRMVDFAAQQGFAYLILDANWYGPEHEAESNPTDLDRSQDIKKLISYAKDKGVGIWLYLNDVGGKKYSIEQTLKQYGDWGAAGVKYGFMIGTPEEKNKWTQKITKLCADNRLLINFHDDPIHPYGQMRTFPNAVTREYCQAQLDAHKVFPPSTFTSSVFVNMIAGPLDMNNGMFDLRQGLTTRVDENKPVPSTVVSEAARTLIVFSGATVIPDIPEFYHRYPPLLEFLSAQKMPWRESCTLAGEIGEYIVMARQSKDEEWLIGAATNELERTVNVSLDFLETGKYEATVTQDAPNSHFLNEREKFQMEKIEVDNTSSLTLRLAPGGGACVLIQKRK